LQPLQNLAQFRRSRRRLSLQSHRAPTQGRAPYSQNNGQI